ncbi:MAG: hypothetical protein ACI9XO_003228, partial [Paraglaciecola sp.]
MQKTILTRFFSKSQFLVWGLLVFGMLSFSGNANGQCATIAGGPSLMNPGFEDGFNEWETQGNPIGFFIDNVSPQSGANHATFRHGGGQPIIRQSIPASAGDMVTGSFDVLVNSPITGAEFVSFQLLFWSANNDFLGIEVFDLNAVELANGFPIGSYETIPFTGTAPANTMRAELFMIFLDNGPPGSGSLEIFVDDATLTSDASVCGSSMMFTVDDACNLPFVNIPQLTIDAPCGFVSVTNDFNGTDNASDDYPIGTTDVVFTVVDNDGTSTCEFSIEVVDMTSPVVNCGGVSNAAFDFPGTEAYGCVNAFDQSFGSDLPGGSGAPMAVMFNGCGFGVLVYRGIPSSEGEVITAGYSGFLPGDFTNSGSYAGIKFEFYDANGGLVFNTGDIVLWDDQDATGFWEERTATVTAPAGTAEVVVVPLFVGPGSAILVDDIVYFNSMTLYEVENNNADCLAFVDLFDYTAMDACSAVTTTNDFNGTASPDGLFPLGTTMVTTTFEDEAGNTSVCIQTVINTPGGECAQAEITDPCVCLDNATSDLDGQFGELIEVNGSTGQIWTVTASTGLYVVDANDASVQATAGVVYPLVSVTGIQLVESPVGSGFFQLAGAHVDAIGYSVAVTNLFTGQILTIGQTCNYPTASVTGLDAVGNNACLADGTFDFVVSPNAAGQLDVTVDGASAFSGTIAANSNNPISVDVTALGTGTYAIEVSFDADDANAPNPGCALSYDYTLTVGEPQGTLTCNDNIQVSLDQNCEAALTADMILEGTYTGAFDISIAGVTGTVLNGSHIGNTYTVTVSDACGVNSCWSMISVEDKLAPVVNCIDRVITCTADISTVPAPSASDNCDANPTVTLVDSVLGDADVCDDNQVIYVQTYVAVDAQGNTSAPCQRSVAVVRPTADMVNFPDDLVWSCEQYAAYPHLIAASRLMPSIVSQFGGVIQILGNTNAWNLTTISLNDQLLTNNLPGTTVPTGSGIPTEIDGVYCQYGYTSAEQVLSTCGYTASTDEPVFKIIRTWTVLDWCSGQIITVNAMGEDNVQVIKVIDQVAPVVSGANVTISANISGQHPQACTGQGPIALGTAVDNCTGASNLQGFVYSSIALNSAIAQITQIGATNSGLLNPALPVGSYFIVWTAEDGCGNFGQSTTYTLTVQDDIAPVAICDEITQVALSSDGLAVVYAGTFDDGSYDNCCLDRIEVRRMADDCDVAGNTTFGES